MTPETSQNVRDQAILNVLGSQRSQALDAVAMLMGDLAQLRSEHDALLQSTAKLQQELAELRAKYLPSPGDAP